jgi:predicted Zn-ribbon and HTH transcriptional regulator
MNKNIIENAGANVYIKGHRCYRCGHEWKPNNMKQLPKVCPKCKSPYWDKPKTNGEVK